MSYKTIVVHVDHDRRASVRIQAAAALANRFGAHLVGLHATTPARIPNYVRSEVVADIIAHEREARRAVDVEMAARFDQIATRAGVDSREWRLSNHDPVDALTLHARYADLLVRSSATPALPDHHSQRMPPQHGAPVSPRTAPLPSCSQS